MSLEALAIVLHHARASGTAKLVLLGIANHAGDGGAWPKVSTLATYANVSDRAVQRAVRGLVATGELAVDYQAGGLPHMRDVDRPNRYTVLVKCPPDCDRTSNHRTPPHVIHRGDAGVTPDRAGGDAGVTPGGDAGVTRTSPINPGEPVPKIVTGGRPTICTVCNRTKPAHDHAAQVSGDDHPWSPNG